MPRGLRLALVVLGATCALLGLVAGYVRLELADRDAFADRGVAALQSRPVAAVVGQQVAVQLVERESPDLIATRPLVVSAVEALIGTRAFAQVLRSSALTTHDVLLDGDGDVAIDLRQIREVVLPALRTASPRLARQVPLDVAPRVATLRASSPVAVTVRVVDAASVAALPLLLVALACFGVAVVSAPDRRGALGGVGAALLVAMGLGLAALAALRLQALAGAGSLGVLAPDDARAAAASAWEAFAGDLQRLLVAVGVGGLLLWAGALAARSSTDRSLAVQRVADALVGGHPAAGVRALRGVALAALGAVLLLRVEPVATVAVVVAGLGLALLGLTEAASAVRSRPAVRPRRPRRGVVLAAGAVVLLLVGAGAAVLATRGGAPTPLRGAAVTRCEGMAVLCDRRLDQVVLPGTHNSMSAVDRPGWLLTNQQHAIPRQLDDGIRLLLIDPHYGVVDAQGRVRTDLEAEGTTRNRVAAELGPDGVRAAERLAGQIGLVPTDGERSIFLCHSVCELGATRLSSTLREVRGWLEQHPAEVLVLQTESSVSADDLEEAFHDADLDPYLEALPRTGPLPTLRELITSGRRLVVLDERDGGTEPWYQPGYLLAQSTSIRAFTEDGPGTCEPDRGTPDSPMLLADLWVDGFPPSLTAARRVGTRAALLRTVAACRERLGRIPDLIAVDFYDQTDVVAVARELNASGAALAGRP